MESNETCGCWLAQLVACPYIKSEYSLHVIAVHVTLIHATQSVKV